MKQIEFFFDYLSPYSYIAFSKFLKRRELFENFEVVFTPVVMSQVIHTWDTKGPAEIPPKRDYLMKNCLRIAEREEIPFKTPLTLPFNSLDALRYTLASEWENDRKRFIEQCFQFCWQESGDTSEFEDFKSYMNKAGFDLEKADVKVLRKQLKLNTKRAIEMKLFGVPTFIVHESGRDDELFWGSDSLDDLINFLNDRCHINESEEYLRYKTLFQD